MKKLLNTKFCYIDHNGSFITPYDDPKSVDLLYRYCEFGPEPDFGAISIVEVDADLKSFELGVDGLPYAVFKTNSCTYEYADAIGDAYVGCWDGYENCVQLQSTIGL